MSVPAKRPATWQDLWSLPDDVRAEIVGGSIEAMPSPSVEHQLVVGGLNGDLGDAYMRGRHGGPGGWWIVLDIDVELSPGDIVRPDITGWRRERVPERPVRPVRQLPDWVCEALSPGSAGRDRSVKMELYRKHGVPWVWLADVEARVVEAFRLEGAFYVRLGGWADESEARIPPFDAVPFDLAGILASLGPSTHADAPPTAKGTE